MLRQKHVGKWFSLLSTCQSFAIIPSFTVRHAYCSFPKTLSWNGPSQKEQPNSVHFLDTRWLRLQNAWLARHRGRGEAPSCSRFFPVNIGRPTKESPSTLATGTVISCNYLGWILQQKCQNSSCFFLCVCVRMCACPTLECTANGYRASFCPSLTQVNSLT